MKKLHHHLCRKFLVYHRWHKHPKHAHVHWGFLGAVALGVALSFVILGWQEQSAPFSAKAQEANITINGSTQYQTIDGWGANSQEDIASTEVYQAFVQDLGATIVRIPFPAGAEGATESSNDNPDPSDLNLAAFDITRQVFRKEVSVNLESVKRFRDAADVDRQVKFLLAVFSPPLWMKQPRLFVDVGSDPNWTNEMITVPAGMYPEFAETIIGVIRRFEQEGVTIGYVNLQGEDMCRDSTVPHTCWGEWSFRDMLREVGSRLRTALPNVRIGVPNVSRPTTRSWWSAIKSDNAAYQYADIQMVHYYEWGESQNIVDAFAAMGSDVLNDQKPLWIAETGGPGFNGSTADTFQEGFNEAQKIHQSFTIGNASAFLEYVAYMDAGTSGSNVHRLWRLIELQSDGSIEGFSPKYYAMKRYARNIPPGSRRIEVSGAPSGVKVSAFTHTNGTLTIVALNTTGSNQDAVFRLSGGVSASSLNRYRFSSGCDGVQLRGSINPDCDRNLGPITVAGGSFMDSLPSQSITTFTTGTANVPPPPQCQTGTWQNAGCGQGGCASTQMYQTRTVSPSGCASTSQCVVDTVNCPGGGTNGPVCGLNGCEAGETAQSCPQDCASDGWIFCANENEFCSFSGTKEVRYGANSSYNYLTLTNGTQCSNAVFGDPINGVVKQCYYRDTTTGGPVCPNGTCEPPSETNSTCPQDCGSTQNQPPRNLVLRYLGPTPTGGTGGGAGNKGTSGGGVSGGSGVGGANPNSTYPQAAIFQWGGYPAEFYAKYDLVVTGSSDARFADAIHAINPNTLVLVTKDIQKGLDAAPPSDVWIYDSQGRRIEVIYGNLPIANVAYAGYQSFVDQYLRTNINLNSFNGFSTDGLWDSIARVMQGSGVTDIDIDRNGANDLQEPGKGWSFVDQQWQQGVNTLISNIRNWLGNRPFLVNGSSHFSNAGMINGEFVEGAGSFEFNWYAGMGNYDKYMTLYREPPVSILNPSGYAKDNFKAFRFYLATTLLGDAYLDFEDRGSEQHYFKGYYDEYDLLLGRATPATGVYHKIQCAPVGNTTECVYVRFFERGVAIVNAKSVAVQISDADISGLPGYTGPYRRFTGGQDPNWNNGAQFSGAVTLTGAVTLNPSDQNSRRYMGDALILVTQPQTAVSDIIIGDTYAETSPGSAASVLSGSWSRTCAGSEAWTSGCRNYPQGYEEYLFATAPPGSARADYTPNIGVAGRYEVFEWHGRLSSGSLASNVIHAINHAGGQTVRTVNQQQNTGGWNSLGTYRFNAGTGGNVTLSAQGANGTIMADAIMFRYIGP